MAGYTVDREALAGTIAALHAHVASIDEELFVLETAVARLRGEWSGEAQIAYDSAQSQWTRSMRDLNISVGGVVLAVAGLVVGIATAETAVGALVGVVVAIGGLIVSVLGIVQVWQATANETTKKISEAQDEFSHNWSTANFCDAKKSAYKPMKNSPESLETVW